MFETFFRAFLMIFLMEIGSASQLTIAALSAHTGRPVPVFMGSMSALALAGLLAILLGNVLDRIPVSTNLLSAMVMIGTGIVLLWKS